MRAARENEADLMSLLFKRGEPTDLEADLRSLFKREATDLHEPTESEVGAGIREFARRNVATPRQAARADRELVTNSISTLLQSVAGSSGPAEIDRLMAKLHTLRDLLQAESARIQREITEYAHLSQSAMQTTKIITEGLVMWRNKNARAG